MGLTEYAESVGKTVSEAQAEFQELMTGQNIVLRNADEAYKTAGLSANEYMETVTSFSAALISSLNGDTEAAANAADIAITDMSDNANKMGTSMESIQNAYQGFAKQNYTMLDNLKLGYGGTKEEMQRLLADAEKLSGQKYDISNLNDVYSAIHVIQTELGITGTTAKEASTTISGSVNAMKAAWSNLVVGIADDNQNFDVLINNFVESAAVAADSLLPRIEISIKGIGMLLEKLIPVIVDRIPDIINEVLPDLIQSGINMISSLVRGILDNLPRLAEAAGEIAGAILQGIGDLCPVLKPVTDLIQILIDNFADVLAVIIPLTAAFVAWKAAVSIAGIIQVLSKAMNGMTVAQYAAKVAQDLLNASMLKSPIVLIVTLITALIAAFIYLWNTNEKFRQFWIDLWRTIKETTGNVIDAIVGFFTETIPNAVSSLVDFIKNNWQSLLMLLNPATLLAGIFKLVYDNCEGFRDFVDGFVADIKNFFINAWNTILSFFAETLPSLPEKFMYWLGYTLTSIALWGADLVNWAVTNIPIFVENVVAFISELPSKIGVFLGQVVASVVSWKNNMILKATEIGSSFINGIINFVKTLPQKIASFLSEVIGNVVGFASNMRNKALEAGQGFFDNIVSTLSDLPCKMGEIGGNIVAGIMTGISNGWGKLVDYVKNLANSLLQGVKDALGIHSPSRKFKYLGEMCVAGFDDGMDDLMNPDAMTRNINASMSTVQANMTGARASRGIGGFGNFNQTINVNQQISTPDELARAVRVESRYGLMRGVAFG